MGWGGVLFCDFMLGSDMEVIDVTTSSDIEYMGRRNLGYHGQSTGVIRAETLLLG